MFGLLAVVCLKAVASISKTILPKPVCVETEYAPNGFCPFGLQ